MRKIKKIWQSFDSLDDRIFFLTVVVSIVVSVIVYVADVIAGLTLEAQVAVLIIIILMVLLLVLGVRYPSGRGLFRLILVLTMNFIMFPLSFFFSGGIHSGMILFFLVGLFLVPVMLRGRSSILLFVLSLVDMIIMIDVAQYCPRLVAPMTMEQHYQDVKVTLLISGAGLFIITVLVLGAYDREHAKNMELMESLRALSVKDALSGLYNRRELYRRLEIMYRDEEAPARKDTLIRENHYIAMFDIDDFKAVNDTYGHDTGDRVLQEVSRVLNEMVDPGKGEIASRYGGEEFVCILCADSPEEAFRRADEARQKVSAIRWEHGRPGQVTISGGIVPCMEKDQLTESMKAVDQLLYQAKASGKNRIIRRENSDA